MSEVLEEIVLPLMLTGVIGMLLGLLAGWFLWRWRTTQITDRDWARLTQSSTSSATVAAPGPAEHDETKAPSSSVTDTGGKADAKPASPDSGPPVSTTNAEPTRAGPTPFDGLASAAHSDTAATSQDAIAEPVTPDTPPTTDGPANNEPPSHRLPAAAGPASPPPPVPPPVHPPPRSSAEGVSTPFESTDTIRFVPEEVDHAHERQLDRMAAAMARNVWRKNERGLGPSRHEALRSATHRRDRPAGVDFAIERAVSRKWIQRAEDDGITVFVPGRVKPPAAERH